MFYLKKVLYLLSLSVTSLFAIAQENALTPINTTDLRRHLSFISSDSLQGRSFDTPIPGLEIAAEYLKTNIEKMGLSPGREGYFQSVPIISSQPNFQNSYLQITDRKNKEIFKTESLVYINGSEVKKTVENAECIFAGFGSPELEKQNVEDKIIIIAQGDAETFKNGTSANWKNNLERNKFSSISKYNPRAIIIITSTSDKEQNTFKQIKAWFEQPRFLFTDKSKINETPIIVALPEFADKLLGGKAKYENYLSSVADSKQTEIIGIEDFKLNFLLALKTETIETKNVLGLIEGSDPILKNECLVFMAHYDHLGLDKNGEVFNGADDNGSGSATLIELAEAFGSLEPKPKRSIVFLWVTAEEKGMLGSQYYAEHPLIPMEKTVACINIDMDGRVFEPRDSVWNNSPKKVKDFDGLYTLTNEFWPGLKEINSTVCSKLGLNPDYSLPSYFLRSSDHFSFHKKSVPILNYSTGYHADYHKVTDDISRINFDKMKRVADLCFLVGMEIANLDKIERPEN